MPDPYRRTRRTARRAAVLRALTDAEGFLSANDLHRRLETEQPRISLATLYRHLNALADSAEIDVIDAPSGQLFRHCSSTRHHHHLICQDCGHTVEITPPVDTWLHDVAAEHGYIATRHVLEAFGRCASCQTPDNNTSG